MTSILLLGGNGFLGSRLSLKLREVGYRVVVADLREDGFPTLEFIKLNILSGNNLASVLADYDVIINLTGQISTPINGCFRLNTLGISNILSALKRKGQYFVQISTVSVYGTHEFVDENTPLNPETPYAVCKAFAEFQIQKSLELENYSILRLSNLFGIGQAKGLFSYLRNSANGDRNLIFDNDGSLLRYYLNIEDCVEAITLALKFRISGIHNICGDKAYSLVEIIKLFKDLHKIDFSVIYSKTKPLENIQKISMDKFMQITGFVPMYTVEDYIKGVFSYG